MPLVKSVLQPISLSPHKHKSTTLHHHHHHHSKLTFSLASVQFVPTNLWLCRPKPFLGWDHLCHRKVSHSTHAALPFPLCPANLSAGPCTCTEEQKNTPYESSTWSLHSKKYNQSIKKNIFAYEYKFQSDPSQYGHFLIGTDSYNRSTIVTTGVQPTCTINTDESKQIFTYANTITLWSCCKLGKIFVVG